MTLSETHTVKRIHQTRKTLRRMRNESFFLWPNVKPVTRSSCVKPEIELHISNKALNRENRLECIQQYIRVRFNHRLRALILKSMSVEKN